MASISLFNTFFNARSYFVDDDTETAGFPLPPKASVKAIISGRMVIEKAVAIDTIVIPCSLNKVQYKFVLPKIYLQRILSLIFLIHATCIRRSF